MPKTIVNIQTDASRLYDALSHDIIGKVILSNDNFEFCVSKVIERKSAFTFADDVVEGKHVDIIRYIGDASTLSSYVRNTRIYQDKRTRLLVVSELPLNPDTDETDEVLCIDFLGREIHKGNHVFYIDNYRNICLGRADSVVTIKHSGRRRLRIRTERTFHSKYIDDKNRAAKSVMLARLNEEDQAIIALGA